MAIGRSIEYVEHFGAELKILRFHVEGQQTDTKIILWNMKRRNFLKYSAAAFATTASTSALSQSAQAATHLEPTQIADALNPGGIRVAGIRMIPVAGGKYKVWTKQIGSGSVKVLLLHGGPGFPHDYLEAMESFLPQARIEMYYYDQLGVGNSDVPDNPTLWTLPRYLSEVEEVRRGLGLDHFVLYGHSWGGMLAIEYALNYQQHLRGLVISNMTAGIQSYLKRTASLKTQLLSTESLAKFNAMEAAKDYEVDWLLLVETGQLASAHRPSMIHLDFRGNFHDT